MKKITVFPLKIKKGRQIKGKKRSLSRNIKIANKYLLGFLLTAVLFIVAGLIIFSQLKTTLDNVKTIDKRSSRVNEMSELASLLQIKDVQISDYLLTGRNKYVTSFTEYQKQIYDLLNKLEPTLDSKEQQNIFHQIKEKDEKINDMFFGEIKNAVEENQEYMAIVTRNNSSVLREDTVELVHKLMDIIKLEQTNSVKETNKSLQFSSITLIISNITAILLGVVLMILISKSISASLKKVVGITTQLANGNLSTNSLDYEGNDEIGQLATSVNKMKENIYSILSKVASASESVSTRSDELTQSANEVKESNEQIAHTMEELSSGAETQANSSSNLLKNMNDFVKKVRSSEQSGQEIFASSTDVLQLTKQGTELMQQSVQQMQKIDSIVAEAVHKVQGLDKQSNEISNLVSVIKDIADQTNLLSLNAAIEAARAGEHGRGFAVVAEEVRKLSDQVAVSVGEITTIVHNIQNETDHVVDSLSAGYDEVIKGTNQIEKTGSNFKKINQAVSNVNGRIKQISVHLQDLANGSNSMNDLIEEIASVAEESAAGVEQAAASAQQTSSSMDEVSSNAIELSELAEQLNDELKVFKL